MLWRQFFQQITGARIRIRGGEAQHFISVFSLDQKLHLALIPVQCGFDGLHEPLAHALTNHQSIHHDLDPMLHAALGIE